MNDLIDTIIEMAGGRNEAIDLIWHEMPYVYKPRIGEWVDRKRSVPDYATKVMVKLTIRWSIEVETGKEIDKNAILKLANRITVRRK